jgi:N-methylhydantoinase A
LRYFGQSHELEVPVDAGWEGVVDDFHIAHRERFGFDRPAEPVEVVNVRAVASGVAPLSWKEMPHLDDRAVPLRRGAAWDRSSLPAGFVATGPDLVVEDDSATLLEAGGRMMVEPDGTLRIDL